MTIRVLRDQDLPAIFAMMRAEGDEWRDYWGEPARYRAALQRCLVLVADAGGAVCGFARCWDDRPYGLHVVDLLVARASRGQGLGLQLINAARNLEPPAPVYVHSDVDEYYQKQGLTRVGSIFELRE